MSEFILNESRRFAKVIHANVGNFQNLLDLRERFEKEIISYKGDDSREMFFTQLALELDKLFLPHLNKCKRPECPQLKTYKNITFLISEESKTKMLSSFLFNNTEFDTILEQYNKKLVTISSFMDKERFITEEIERIKTLFVHCKIEIKSIEGGRIISSFDFSEYSKFAFEWLMRGHDLKLEQIINNAKNQYNSKMPNGGLDEKQFEDAIQSNLRRGVAFILYDKFLNTELKSLTENSNKKYGKNANTKRRATIPFKIKALLQKEINSTCPFCPSQDVGHFEVHHIDENCENNVYDNLFMVCPTCHSKITKGDIPRESVVSKKQALVIEIK